MFETHPDSTQNPVGQRLIMSMLTICFHALDYLLVLYAYADACMSVTPPIFSAMHIVKNTSSPDLGWWQHNQDDNFFS